MILEVIGIRCLHKFYLIKKGEVLLHPGDGNDRVQIEGEQYYSYNDYKIFLKDNSNNRFVMNIDSHIQEDYLTHITYGVEVKKITKFGGITHRPTKRMFIDLKFDNDGDLLYKSNGLGVKDTVLDNELISYTIDESDYYMSDYLSVDLSSFRESNRYRNKSKVWLFSCEDIREELTLKSLGLDYYKYSGGVVAEDSLYVTSPDKVEEFKSNLPDIVELVLVNCSTIVKCKDESSVMDNGTVVNIIGFKEQDHGFDFVLSNNTAIILDNGQLTYEKEYLERPDRFFEEDIKVNVKELFTKYFNGEEDLIDYKGFKLTTHRFFTGDGYDTVVDSVFDRAKLKASSKLYQVTHLPVVFKGDSSAGKSYLSENLSNIFDTDLSGELPEYFENNTLTVIGNLKKFTEEEIHDRCSVSTIVCDFKIITDLTAGR